MPDLSVNGLWPLLLGVAGALLGGVTLSPPRLRRSARPPSYYSSARRSWPPRGGNFPARSPDQATDEASLADYKIQLREVKAVKVVTDRGRRIRLGTPVQPVPLTDLSGVEKDHFRTHDLNRKVVVRSEPDPSHNCHGWVFTGGLFWVAGVVDDILVDNDYRLVSTPAVGDLAVYRGAEGKSSTRASSDLPRVARSSRASGGR